MIEPIEQYDGGTEHERTHEHWQRGFYILSIFLIFGVIAMAAGRFNAIYLGEDVGSINGKHDAAVEIYSDGTVAVYIGAVVPGLHDSHGNPVKVRKVRTVRQ